ncbi:MAG: metallophosphoesterase [Paracoccaceae bacterium]
MRVYAIGDIHGHRDKLETAHHFITADRKQTGDTEAPVVHIGDLVDRGPDSKGVLDFLIAGLDANAPWVVLMGNHDRMFLHFLADHDNHDPGLRADLHWIHPRLGGVTTLASYGISSADERPLADIHREVHDLVPQSHIGFLLDRLVLYWRMPGLFFAHAGIRPGVALSKQQEDDLLWIRGTFLDDKRDHGALVVHGHTPVKTATHYGNRVNIDTGAGYGEALTAVVIEDGQVWRLGAGGREEIARAGRS